MSNKCRGCGLFLQYTDQNAKGYSPKKDAIYCQRCFRLQNYGEFNQVIKPSLDNEAILKNVSKINGLILWVVDLFDFESCLINGFNKYFVDKDVILVLTKKDLLPKTLTNEKLIKFISNRLKDFDIKVCDIIVSGFKEDMHTLYQNILKASNKQDLIVIGMANAGKSTLLNNFIEDNKLTVSRYPNTTLEFNEIKGDDQTFIDTPGLAQTNSLLSYLKKEDLKYLIPISPIKPKVYQIYENQSFAIGGLLRIDIEEVKNASVVFYISNALMIHRGKAENANDLWRNHYGKLLIPKTISKYEEYKNTIIKTEDGYDIAIFGLGWISISGDAKKVNVIHHPNVEVIKREVLM